MNVSTRQQARELFEGMGYQHVHTWEESHGNGGQDMYERLSPMMLCKPQILCVSFGQGGVCTHLSFRDDGSFLLAREVLEGDDFEKVGHSKTSACCTASSTNYRPKPGLGLTTKCFVSVSSVAGHGTKAVWVKGSPPLR
jgi:hypothetical protein